MSCDILIYTEDPAAVNFIQEILPLLRSRGRTIITLNREKVTKIGLDEHDLLRRYQPTLILVGTAEDAATMGLKLITAARDQAIKSIGFVDAQVNAEHRFRGLTDDPLGNAPDMLIVPDIETRRFFLKLGYPANQIKRLGHPLYDKILNTRNILNRIGIPALKRKLFSESAQNRFVISFVSEISDGILNISEYMYSQSYTLKGSGKYQYRTQIVIESLLNSLQNSDANLYLVLRLHPKNTHDDFADLINHFDFVSQAEPSWEIAYASDLVLGMTSSLLYEAHLLGKPTLSILPRAIEKNWLKALTSGIIPYVADSKALTEWIDHFIREPTQFRVSPDTNQLGGATERIANFIEKQLEEG